MASSNPSGIDCHVHVFSVSGRAAVDARYRPAYTATLAALRTLWAANAITHGVIVQPSFFGTDNSEMLAAVALDREHLRGVAMLDPTARDEDIARLDAAGVVALRLNLKGRGDYAAYATEEWKALYRRAHTRGWHLEIFTDAGRVPELMPALLASDAGVVFDHFGNPGMEEARAEATFAAIATLAASRPIHTKLSAPYRLGGVDRRTLADRWIEIVGSAGLVWGSDWPWTLFEERNDYRQLRQDLDRWVGAAVARMALWDNAARLYRF